MMFPHLLFIHLELVFWLHIHTYLHQFCSWLNKIDAFRSEIHVILFQLYFPRPIHHFRQLPLIQLQPLLHHFHHFHLLFLPHQFLPLHFPYFLLQLVWVLLLFQTFLRSIYHLIWFLPLFSLLILHYF